MVTRFAKWSAAAAALIVVLGAAAAPAGAAEDAGKAKAALVDVNTASAAELEKLPGVGPALAKRIVEFRDKNGPFQNVDELLKVQGIGEKSLARFRDLVTAGKPAKK
jgi:competence protein ComEA